jgi:tripartite-type tricarboxylate transporter receptor subunit TctC
MKGQRMHHVLALLAACVGLAVSLTVFAQAYPVKPVRLIVPFVPGGAVDITARVIAPGLSEELGGNVIIENRVGAGGTIGADLVAKSPPDGYTLMLGSNSTLSVAPSLFPKNPYDPIRDFAPISLINTTPFVLVVRASLDARSLGEFIAIAKAKPGHLTMGSGGTGSSSHLVGELFQMLTRTQITHIPYKGSGQALVDLVAGQIDVVFDQLASSTNNIRAGKTHAIALASKARAAVIPDVPTMAEAGLANFEVTNIIGILAPANTPADIIEKVNTAIRNVLGRVVVKERFSAIGVDASPSTPAAFGAFIREDLAKWTKVVKEAHIKVE